MAVYVLYFAAAVLTHSPLLASSGPSSAQEMAVAALVDPFGLAAFFEQTHHWTSAERDARSISLTGHLLLNRLIWTVAAVLLVALAHRLFAFRVPTSGCREGDRATASSVRGEVYRPVRVHGAAAWPAILSATRLEFRALLRSWPFIAILLLWIGAAAIQVFENIRRAEYGTALLPTAGLILRHLDMPRLLFGLLVIVYFSGELIWRERTVRAAEIVDATPASSARHHCLHAWRSDRGCSRSRAQELGEGWPPRDAVLGGPPGATVGRRRVRAIRSGTRPSRIGRGRSAPSPPPWLQRIEVSSA